MKPICEIRPLDKYRLLIGLTSGHIIVLDLTKKIHTVRFRGIANPDVFKKAATDGYSVMWLNGRTMISFGEILDILGDK